MSNVNGEVNESISPWGEVARDGLELGGGTPPLLILASPGSLQIECAREIHSDSGGGPFEPVFCTPDPVEVRTQLFGPTYGAFSEILLFESDLPVGAVQRATGGTLYLESVDRCHPESASWLQFLLSGQPVQIGGNSVTLDPSTRVIASVTSEWMDRRVEHLVPSWLLASFDDRVLALEPLSNRLNDLADAIEWFYLEASGTHGTKPSLTADVKTLLQNHQWPGDLFELRTVMRTLLSAESGEVVTSQVCERVLAKHQSEGMTAIDGIRRMYCRTYAEGISYMGRPIEARDVYEWVSQFPRVSVDKRIDSWSIGLSLARGITERYYFSSDQLRILIRDAYLSLFSELAENSARQCSVLHETGSTPPGTHAVLVNPLGPLKSASGVMPHMAHLLGAGYGQDTVLVEEVADYLASHERTRLIVFCDDFAGTGQQVQTELVRVLAESDELKELCERRNREGTPVALAVILGVCFEDGLEKIRGSGPNWLPIMAHAGRTLRVRDKAFSDCSLVFPEPEQRALAKTLILDTIGTDLSSRWPGGFGDLQALVVTADNVPNNTLPAIWKSGSVHGFQWRALFSRASTPT